MSPERCREEYFRLGEGEKCKEVEDWRKEEVLEGKVGALFCRPEDMDEVAKGSAEAEEGVSCKEEFNG